jgi:hypothetical protein
MIGSNSYPLFPVGHSLYFGSFTSYEKLLNLELPVNKSSLFNENHVYYLEWVCGNNKVGC